MEKRIIKALSELLLIVMIGVAFAVPILWSLESLPTKAYAVDDGVFETRDVLDDLLSSEIATDGESKPFDITDFPKDPTARSPKLLNVVEYCYSVRRSIRQYYGLYLYVYNPQAIDFEESSVQNKVELATKYKEDGTPDGYEKFDLRFCSKSTAVGYENVFYKYKVVDRETENGGYILDRVDKTDARRYDISGFELLTRGANNAEDYKVGGTYTFTGYSKGCGGNANAESDLKCSVVDLEVLKLKVKPTYWRNPVSGGSTWGDNNSQKEIKSVYFSIPNSYLKKYGTIDEIHAEYYAYNSNLMFITTDFDLYTNLIRNKGVYISDYNSSVYSFYSSRFTTGLTYAWAFNPNSSLKDTERFEKRIYQVPWVFDGGRGSLEDCQISSSEVMDYASDYDCGYSYDRIPSKTSGYFKELFYPDDHDGYRNVHISKNDTFDIITSGWDKFLQYGFRFDKYDDVPDHYGESPIKLLEASDLLPSDKDLSNNLFVAPSDVDEFREFAVAEMLLNRTPVLFRYRQDYYRTSNRLFVSKNGEKPVQRDIFSAWQKIVLDFDIIDLTFEKDGVYRVIPVVSDPIDIFNGINPPPKKEGGIVDIIKMIITVVLTLILIVVVLKLFTLIIRFFGWLFRSKRKKNQ